MYREQIEAEAGDRRFDPDFGRVEPVFQFSAVKHQLHGANPETQCREAEEIKPFTMDIPGLADEDEDTECAKDSNWQIDVEDPPPTEFVSQPAAQRRPHDRPNDRAGTKYRHRGAVPLRRIDLQQGRLRQWYETGAANPLQASEEHQ